MGLRPTVLLAPPGAMYRSGTEVGDRGEEAIDGGDKRQAAAAPAALVHPCRLGGPPGDPPAHRWAARTVARQARALGNDADHDRRPPEWEEAQRDPRLLRGWPELGHDGDERLGGA